MSVFHAIVLGLLQGATEFIPISSSGHLVLVPWLFGWDKAPLAFDTMVHWGTMVAVVSVFWRDLRSLLVAGLKSTLVHVGRARVDDKVQARLAWAIVLGSLPAALAGFILEDFFEELFGKPSATAGLLLVTAAVLVFSERASRQEHTMREIGWLDALFIGTAQAVAIMPGISRSGATIAAGLARGVQREAAARFSFLLSTPVILGAGMYKLMDLIGSGGLGEHTGALALGFASAAVSGYFCIRWLLRYLVRHPLYVFAAYCLFFGVFNLILALLRG
jgi:undecaprenyl-diphosphatase